MYLFSLYLQYLFFIFHIFYIHLTHKEAPGFSRGPLYDYFFSDIFRFGIVIVKVSFLFVVLSKLIEHRTVQYCFKLMYFRFIVFFPERINDLVHFRLFFRSGCIPLEYFLDSLFAHFHCESILGSIPPENYVIKVRPEIHRDDRNLTLRYLRILSHNKNPFPLRGFLRPVATILILISSKYPTYSETEAIFGTNCSISEKQRYFTLHYSIIYLHKKQV